MTDTPTSAHHRRSVRLRDYDYTQAGAYFVTICTHQRGCFFGSIVNNGMTLSDWGDIAQAEWQQTALQRTYVELDAFVIMPNHIHGILLIIESGVRGMMQESAQDGSDVMGRGMMHHAPTPPNPDQSAITPRQFGKPIAHSLAIIVGTYKAAVTRRINRMDMGRGLMHQAPTTPVWQRNYYEHIIRNDEDLNRIRAYIETNPARWQEDSLYIP